MADFEKNVEEMVGRLEKRRVATDSGGDETGDETGGPGGSGDETGDKTAATAGDERDGGDRWGNVYGRSSVYITQPVAAISTAVPAVPGTRPAIRRRRRTRWRRPVG